MHNIQWALGAVYLFIYLLALISLQTAKLPDFVSSATVPDL